MTDLATQIRDGSAPQNIRQYAAQGLLPFPEDELIPLQVFLSHDKNTTIAEMADTALRKIGDDTWMRLVGKQNPDPDILEYCLHLNSFPVKEKIILNHSVSDEVIANIAKFDTGPVIDLIINNQVRLLRYQNILTNLESNPHLTADQKRRLEEFKTEFVYKKQAQAPSVQEIVAAPIEDLLALIPDLDEESIKVIQEADAISEPEMTDEEAAELVQKMLSAEEASKLPPEIVGTYQKILKMNRAGRLRLALLGTKEERGFLVRDSSRQVASMVLKSPKLTDPEVEGFAQMRNLDSDILRQIGMGREFIKNYVVVHSLVKNPKTPSPISLNLLKLLRTVDLKNLERDKNIPEIIRRQAKKQKDMKEAQRR